MKVYKRTLFILWPPNYSKVLKARTHSLAGSLCHHWGIYILVEVCCFLSSSFFFFVVVLVLYFILEAIVQDNLTAEGFKQQLLQFPVEETWLCERTSQYLLSWKSPLKGLGTTVCCQDRWATGKGGVEMCELKLKAVQNIVLFSNDTFLALIPWFKGVVLSG